MVAKTIVWILITALLWVAWSRRSTSFVNLTAYKHRAILAVQSQLEELTEKVEQLETKLGRHKTEDILLNQQLRYTNHILACNTRLTEIPYYSREVRTVIPYSNLEIRLSIPFSGNEAPGRTRVVLFFDGLPVADRTMYNSNAWPLLTLNFHARVQNVAPGIHKLVLKAAVDNNRCLHIPHYDTDAIEKTVDPPLTSSYLVVGHR